MILVICVVNQSPLAASKACLIPMDRSCDFVACWLFTYCFPYPYLGKGKESRFVSFDLLLLFLSVSLTQ